MNRVPNASAPSAPEGQLPVAPPHSARAAGSSSRPLVSVVILTCDRPQEAERAVRSVLDQDYSHKEIIIVENNSRGRLRHFAQSSGPAVQVLEFPENRGACAGRNAGLKSSRGEFLVTLDDDVVFGAPDSLSTAVRLLSAEPTVAALAFWVGDPRTGEVSVRDWCHPRPFWLASEKQFPTYFLTEGAMAFRRAALDSVGLYDERLFIAGEGHDLAMRILDRGFQILYAPAVRSWHFHSPSARRSDRPYYFMTRNYFWIAFKDYPWPDNLAFLLPKLAMMAYFALRTGHWRTFFRGIADGVRGLKTIWPGRSPVQRSTLRYLAEQDSLRPSYLTRLRRHKRVPLL